ncbi:MAG: 6-phosphofructokinase [Verrucomicrobiales bacterium]|jgi:6-phosphofructokinase 1|nr:6-phosphofructokinase [Verrucomicrobiales bacterium]
MMKRIAVLTSGGDSPGMNPAIRSVVRTGVGLAIDVIGIENGYQGIFDNQFIPLGAIEVSGKNRDAGTFLATTRCMEMMRPDGPARAVEILRRHKIDGLVVIGGDGSLRGAQEIHHLGHPVIGLPGTIDNDIFGTDSGIGVDTALNTIIHSIDMIKATAASHRRCFIIEVMGRSCGYLALMSGITTGSQAAVIPEYKHNPTRIIDALNRRMQRKHNNSVIVVAEGVCTGQAFMDELLAAGKGKFDQEIRLTVLGHLQRGGSPTHSDRLLGSRMGEFAVLSLLQGETGAMVATVGGNMRLRNFDEIRDKKKVLPADAIRLAKNLDIEIGDVTE